MANPVVKLWQAMLAGCDRREQAFAALFDQDGDMLKSCAMGAAMEGAYKDIIDIEAHREDYLNRLRNDYPILCEYFDWVRHGADGKAQPTSLESIILDANDRKRWTREDIAMEIVKPKEEADDVDGTS